MKKLFTENNVKYPIIVLSDNLRSLFSLLIRRHEHGNYSHAMILYEKNKLASQEFLFRTRDLDKYKKPYIRLKFFELKEVSDEDREYAINKIKEDLKKPFYKRTYDFLGILGHVINFPSLNNPFRTYCTERVVKYLRLLKYRPPSHPTPSELNEYLMKNRCVKLLGYWFEDV